MKESTDKTELILPQINKALDTAGKITGEIVRQKTGKAYLALPGTLLEIHQVGTLTTAMLPQILKGMTQDGSILWAQYITESIAEDLTRQGICYADTAGNILLRFGGNFLQVRNCPKPPAIKENLVRGRCLTPAGLQVLFLLLTEPGAVAWNYRNIAAQSGTTLGTVTYVMADLWEKDFLVECRKVRRLVELPKLRQLWVDNYRLRLLPKIKSTRYAGTIVKLPGDDTLVRGGETVAEQEQLLQTGNALLWKQGESISRTVIENRWHLDPRGNIEIREAFWPVEMRRFKGHVPWLLVYADLLATDDGRCIEVAEEIRKSHLEKAL